MARMRKGGREWTEQTRADIEYLAVFLSTVRPHLEQARRINRHTPRLCEEILTDVLDQIEVHLATVDRLAARLPDLETMLQRAETSWTLAALAHRVAAHDQRLAALEDHLAGPATEQRRVAPDDADSPPA